MRYWILTAMWAGIVALHWVVLWTLPPGDSCLLRLGDTLPVFPWLVHERDIWIHALLLSSPLVLMPLASSLTAGAPDRAAPFGVEAAAAVLVGISLLMSPLPPQHHPLPVLLATPWLLVRLWAAGLVVLKWWNKGVPELGDLLRDVAWLLPAVGAAWLVAGRMGLLLWGFDPLIVLLTAAHFHHAGFTLPLMAGLHAKATSGLVARLSCVAVLLGVPLVAAGIGCTHFGVLPLVEPVGVAVLVVGALCIAGLQIMCGVEVRSGLGGWTRAAFMISGASLFLAMFLALGFGLRYFFPSLALTMPQMWMIHGTLNTFGFGLCGILAWRSMPPLSHP